MIMSIAKYNNLVESLKQYFKGVRSELRAMVWPTRQEATKLTLMVIVGSIAVGGLLVLFDLIFQWGLERLLENA